MVKLATLTNKVQKKNFFFLKWEICSTPVMHSSASKCLSSGLSRMSVRREASNDQLYRPSSTMRKQQRTPLSSEEAYGHPLPSMEEHTTHHVC